MFIYLPFQDLQALEALLGPAPVAVPDPAPDAAPAPDIYMSLFPPFTDEHTGKTKAVNTS